MDKWTYSPPQQLTALCLFCPLSAGGVAGVNALAGVLFDSSLNIASQSLRNTSKFKFALSG